MKKVRNFALLILLGFTLSGAACFQLAGLAAQIISKKTHDPNWPPMKRFEVSVRTCDEKNYQAYREVLIEMGYGYPIDQSWVNLSGWRIRAVRDKDEDLSIDCNVPEKKEKRAEIWIQSGIPYFPKESIHQKVLERLKKQAK